MATVLAASLALGSPTLIGGCSFMAVQRPRRDDRGRLEPAGCTTKMFAPGADGIITAALLVGTVATAGTANDSPTTAAPTNPDDQILAGLVLAALFGISAIYGVVTVTNCREASGMVRVPKQTSDERRAEEAAEEAAVQAQWKARAAAAAKAAAAPASADAGAPASNDAGAPAAP